MVDTINRYKEYGFIYLFACLFFCLEAVVLHSPGPVKKNKQKKQNIFQHLAKPTT